MADRRSWSRRELVLAMNLYCKLPFGQLDSRTPQVQRLARLLRRTPGSVAMRLNNLASLDPALAARGIRGLCGVSRADRQIWDEFHENWNALGAESEALAEPIERAPHAPEQEPPEVPAYDGPTEAERTVAVRLAQRFFRQTVLASYECRCCITGNPVPQLLVASHILPWSSHPAERANPRNGLCLARTHDAAFDAGLITFDEDWRLVLSKRLRDYLPNETLERSFSAYEGLPIHLPKKFRPDEAFLEQHRASVFA